MNPEARTCAQDVLRAANLIQSFLADKAFDDFAADIVLRSAVERQFSIIGEAMNALARHDQASAESITTYSLIIAFRNILVHGYSQVDDEIVWDIDQSYVPTLIAEITDLVEQP